MKKKIEKIKLVGVFIDSQHHQVLLARLEKWFDERGVQTCLLTRDSKDHRDVDLIIVLGGDGSVLFALRTFMECPVLGINYGRVGFLTAGNREEFENILSLVLEGKFQTSQRAILDCHYPSGFARVINEVVIKGATKLITVDLIIDGTHIRSIRGDGVVLGTPTGSTAYLLSAGSPIVMPDVKCMIFSGLNEYNFTARNLVIHHEACVQLRVHTETRENEIFLTVDGADKIPLSIDDEVTIQVSKQHAQLIFTDKNFFFNNLSTRLSW